MPGERFPYRFAPAPPVPRYARHRAEWRGPLGCVAHALDYLRKYKHKVWAASPEVVAHFAAQRQVLASMATAPPDGPTMALVGDLMWIRDGWDDFLDPGLLDHLNSHQAVVGNLETVVSPRVAVRQWLPDRLRFNSRPELLTAFRRPGGRNTFAALSLANNHVLDFGPQPLLDTLDLLAREGVEQSGVRRKEDERPFAIIECGDVNVGFYAATWGEDRPRRGRGPAIRVNRIRGLERPEDGVDLTAALEVLGEMEERGAEVRLVALHWGYEYEMFPTPHQMQVARALIAGGADIILGTHPHVVQPAEVCFVNGYQGGAGLGTVPEASRVASPRSRARKALVLYSLGNFTTAMHTIGCRAGLIASMRFYRDDEGKVDWGLLPWRLALNVARHRASDRRRLVFLDDYADHLTASQRQEVSRLKEHLPWVVR